MEEVKDARLTSPHEHIKITTTYRRKKKKSLTEIDLKTSRMALLQPRP